MLVLVKTCEQTSHVHVVKKHVSLKLPIVLKLAKGLAVKSVGERELKSEIRRDHHAGSFTMIRGCTLSGCRLAKQRMLRDQNFSMKALNLIKSFHLSTIHSAECLWS